MSLDAPAGQGGFGELREGVLAQARIVLALTMREIHVRYARENIGFLWIVGEPILFCFGVIAIRSFLPFFPREQHGMSLVGFVMTGYMPFLLFRHMMSRGIHCVRDNHNVLYHRRIRIIDLFLARMILEAAGTIIAFAGGCALFTATGLMEPPQDLLLLYAGWAYAIWFCAALAIAVGAASEISTLVERLYNPFSYLSLPVSGAFYMVNWLPTEWQNYALWIPLVHFFEMIRGGYFGEAVTARYDIGYITAVCLGLTIAALALVSYIRKRVAVA